MHNKPTWPTRVRRVSKLGGARHVGIQGRRISPCDAKNCEKMPKLFAILPLTGMMLVSSNRTYIARLGNPTDSTFEPIHVTIPSLHWGNAVSRSLRPIDVFSGDAFVVAYVPLSMAKDFFVFNGTPSAARQMTFSLYGSMANYLQKNCQGSLPPESEATTLFRNEVSKSAEAFTCRRYADLAFR